MRLKDLRLGRKQAIGFAVVLLLMAAMNIFSILKMLSLKSELDDISQRWLVSAVALGAISSDTSNLRIYQLLWIDAPDDAARDNIEAQWSALIDRIIRNQDTYTPLITHEEQRLYESFELKWEQYVDLFVDVKRLHMQGNLEDAKRMIEVEGQRVFLELSRPLDELVQINQSAAFEAAARADETFQSAKFIVRLMFGITILVSIAIAWGLSRWITVPVRELSRAAQSVSEGDLSVKVVLEGRDEIGQLSDTFNRMTDSLREAREKIEAQQRRLQTANELMAQKNRDLEDALRQLREAQQQLVMREKMASLGNLVAGVAHEINNPVGAVSSAADTSARSLAILAKILDDATSLEELRSSQRFRTAVEILESNNAMTVTASERITEIVKSLKNFARLDESEFQKADLHEGLDSTLTLLHHQLKNRIEVVRDYGDLPAVQCYPNQLNQVFMNILSNASQAIGESGKIEIHTRVDGDDAIVEIADTGKGIDASHMEHIFDPGFTTKGVGVGTGLGLSISYNIIRKHNGRIDVDSEPGRGTTMTIRIPVSQPDPGA